MVRGHAVDVLLTIVSRVATTYMAAAWAIHS